MSREDIVAVAARMLALYGVFRIIALSPLAVNMLSQPDGISTTALFVVSHLVVLAACALLWFFPLTVARKLLPVMHEPRSEPTIDASIALSLGLVLMGLWLLANALLDLSYWLTLLMLHSQKIAVSFEWTGTEIAALVSSIVRLVLALWLLFGTAGIKRLIGKFRHGDL